MNIGISYSMPTVVAANVTSVASQKAINTTPNQTVAIQALSKLADAIQNNQINPKKAAQMINELTSVIVTYPSISQVAADLVDLENLLIGPNPDMPTIANRLRGDITQIEKSVPFNFIAAQSANDLLEKIFSQGQVPKSLKTVISEFVENEVSWYYGTQQLSPEADKAYLELKNNIDNLTTHEIAKDLQTIEKSLLNIPYPSDISSPFSGTNQLASYLALGKI